MTSFRTVLLFLFCTPAMLILGQDIDCLTSEEREQASFYRWLQQQAYAALDARMQSFELLTTKAKIQTYQRRMRQQFVKQLGGFPQRRALNPRTVGIIDADGYRIEKVIFDSQPNHSVTANLYLPDGPGPFPGVVVSSGHSRTAKTADYNQRFGIALATHGMAALCYDPIGQGERSQILNEQGTNRIDGTTTEHFLVGVGSILVGRNTARFRVWDAIRAIDYLQSRPEIDGERIGMTGCSGGGTLTSYTMALDPRIKCAAPSCYLTTFKKLIETIGPQDAEQNVFAQLAFGMDQPDYVIMRAPQPTLISSTTDDFFSIEGTWDNFRQSKRIYTRLGFPERIDLVEADGGHGVRPQSLATITHWMQRWLLGRDEPIEAREYPVRPSSELQCTETGQVLNQADQVSVFDLNAEFELQLQGLRQRVWRQSSHDELRSLIADLIAVDDFANIESPTWEDRGRITRTDYDIDKVVLTTQGRVPLPAVTFHPRQPRDDDTYLYLHDDGKWGDAEPGGLIEQLVADRYAVVSVDLRGQGETGPTPPGRAREIDQLLGDWKSFYVGYLLGRSVVGMRVEDTLTAADFVAHYQRDRDNPRRVHLVGVGQTGIVAWHAAALRPDLFASVTIRQSPRSWSAIVGDPWPAGQLTSTVHNALSVYDLPDLKSLIGDKPVTWEEGKKIGNQQDSLR